MSDELSLAVFFQALADTSRLRIIALLRAMELSVGELAQVLAQSQPRVSRHVRILSEAGLVDRRKEGSWVFLQLADAARTAPLFDAIDRWSDERAAALFAADAARLEAVRADRAEAARRYFEARASAWDSIRSLHVADSEVEQAIADLLTDEPIGALLDIGTGTGRMLELFAPSADSAIGIDRSSEMLRLARVKLEEAQIARASLRQGDMYALPLADGSADSVILHQVLHFAQQPAAAIAEAARVMAPGARLLVVDFAPHEREDLRERDAHLRLGFADDAMRGWFAAAGLKLDRIERLEGGELSVILWRGRRPGVRRREKVAA
ncbi:metalloregulator ArsR/SmtB family transcription factor [Sphingomonas sp. LY29]|uniref:ArsR/SmtB family transcription factor n=1 Tax=Sphingomonas sp. LY29 TaxID=3095341 RepID=UPI002D79C546|nr:metalloregulator ArsR/SmtB family transcription factor [Sphingomonas sp. LY29]WRP25449.1 metalloregulator ArsR/SmtB family transcription factor [Sphingomonas sp. LY29]